MESTEQHWNGSLITSCRSQAVQSKGVLPEAQPDLQVCLRGGNTYADDFVIYTSARSDIDTIQRNLSERHKQLISLRFEESELIINLEKGKTESMLFGTQKIIKKPPRKGTDHLC